MQDHYFSANPLFEAWPEASFFAAPYVCDGIDREYDEKIVYWPAIYGDLVPKNPRKPTRYPFSFFILPGNASSPVILLGPVIGDTVDHSMFVAPPLAFPTRSLTSNDSPMQVLASA